MRFDACLAVFLIIGCHFKIPSASGNKIEGTITKQAIKLIYSLMAGIILTGNIFKETVTILHIFFPETGYYATGMSGIHLKQQFLPKANPEQSANRPDNLLLYAE